MNEAETSDYGTSSLLRVRKGVGRCLGSAHSPLRVLASAPIFGFRLCVRRLCVRVCPNASCSMVAVAFDRRLPARRRDAQRFNTNISSCRVQVDI